VTNSDDEIRWVSPPNDQLIHVVFVHGVDGDHTRTWGEWPRWVAGDFPEAAVGLLRYAAATSEWSGQSMGLLDRGENVLALLKNARVFDRPTLMIAYSFGGLVVKQVWRFANERNDEKVKNALRGVVFIATPHHGAALANFASALSRVMPTLSTQVVRDLRLSTPVAENLHNWYRDSPIEYNWAFRETQKVRFFRWWPRGVLVVDQASADPGIRLVHAEPLTANHIEISRPALPTSQIAVSVKRHIEDFLNGIEAAPEGSMKCPSLVIIKDKEYRIQNAANAEPIRLPAQIPALDFDYGKMATENAKHWKKIHTVSEKSYRDFRDLHLLMLSYQISGAGADKEGVSFFLEGVIDRHEKRFRPSVNELPPAVQEAQPVPLLLRVSECFAVLTKGITYARDDRKFLDSLSLVEWICTCHLVCLRRADAILDVYFKNNELTNASAASNKMEPVSGPDDR
jgi:hypothetical protein